MRSVFFGLGQEFDGGADPGVALNRHGILVEVHKNQSGYKLYGRVGTLHQASISWKDLDGDRDEYTTGSMPACAMNADKVVVEVHKNETGNDLYCMLAQVNGEVIEWGESRRFESDGTEPAVGLTDAGLVVVVYREDGESKLYYRLGRTNFDDDKVDFEDPYELTTSGAKPRVAINNHNQVVAIWEDGFDIKTRVGTVDGNQETITWGDVQDLEGGATPGVALTDDGFVVAVLLHDAPDLHQCTGTLDVSGRRINWESTEVYYDDGKHPVVAAADNWAVTLHQGEAFDDLFYATSVITDRANWMRDRLDRLGGKRVRELVMPASHDSGMYTDGLSVVAKTQELSIYGQLAYGIRYFDLRLKYDAGDERIDIHHGGVEGPTLAEVLADIAQFAGESGRRELCIFDFSHFEDFGPASDSSAYQQFVEEVEEALGDWLFTAKPADRRLADLTLQEYIGQKTALLVTVADDFPLNHPAEGVWIFRNAAETSAAVGDLRVFDEYAKSTVYDTMRDDQLAKYEAYDGICPGPTATTPCDLFLLSWTLTPIIGTGVWFQSKDCNRHLGKVMADLDMPNSHGMIPNLLYVDYCEFARVTDVALCANGEPQT